MQLLEKVGSKPSRAALAELSDIAVEDQRVSIQAGLEGHSAACAFVLCLRSNLRSAPRNSPSALCRAVVL